MKTELEKAQIKVLEKESGREGVDFLIGDNQLYLESNELDTTQRSINGESAKSCLYNSIKRLNAI